MTLINSKPVAVPIAARAPSAMAMPARSKPTVAPPASTPARNGLAVVPPPKVDARTEQGGAAPKIVDDKRGTETSGIAIANDPIPSVPSEAEKTARGNDAGEQTGTLKPTEEQSAEARTAIEEKAVQAFLLAQEAGRQAQAARDAAAAKEAAERDRAARRNANRPFINRVFGFR